MRCTPPTQPPTYLTEGQPARPCQLHQLGNRRQAVQQAAHRLAAVQSVARQAHCIRICGGSCGQAGVVLRLLRRAGQARQRCQAAGAQHLEVTWQGEGFWVGGAGCALLACWLCAAAHDQTKCRPTAGRACCTATACRTSTVSPSRLCTQSAMEKLPRLWAATAWRTTSTTSLPSMSALH